MNPDLPHDPARSALYFLQDLSDELLHFTFPLTDLFAFQSNILLCVFPFSHLLFFLPSFR